MASKKFQRTLEFDNPDSHGGYYEHKATAHRALHAEARKEKLDIVDGSIDCTDAEAVSGEYTKLTLVGDVTDAPVEKEIENK